MSRVFIILLVSLALVNCSPKKGDSNPEEFNYRVEDAPEWSALFKRYEGWFGGDGIFAFPTQTNDYLSPDDTSNIMLLFSDTMIGQIENDSLYPGFRMVNNSLAFMNGPMPSESNIRFLINNDSTGKDISVFVPSTPTSQPGEYLWLGDGFYNHATDRIYIFGYRIINVQREAFGFEETGNILLILEPNDPFPFNNHQQKDTPFWFDSEKDPSGRGSFGVAIYDNTVEAGVPDPDGFIYVYGIRGKGKSLYAGKVKAEEFEKFEKWKFWNGKDWDGMENMVAITDSTSNEMSISPLNNGKYLLVCQIGGVSKKVGIRVGESPVGPFGELIPIWDCSEALEEPEFFSYNAKGHPALSQPGELLVSYNVNSFAFWQQIGSYPHLYRPRFFKIIFE